MKRITTILTIAFAALLVFTGCTAEVKAPAPKYDTTESINELITRIAADFDTIGAAESETSITNHVSKYVYQGKPGTYTYLDDEVKGKIFRTYEYDGHILIEDATDWGHLTYTLDGKPSEKTELVDSIIDSERNSDSIIQSEKGNTVSNIKIEGQPYVFETLYSEPGEDKSVISEFTVKITTPKEKYSFTIKAKEGKTLGDLVKESNKDKENPIAKGQLTVTFNDIPVIFEKDGIDPETTRNIEDLLLNYIYDGLTGN